VLRHPLLVLRHLRKGYLFVFVTPEEDKTWDDDYEEEDERINKLSFETKFMSKMYTEGKVDDREWSSTKGSFMSGRAWCKEQCFNPSWGFADEGWGWGFGEGEEASGIMDWERRHLASVSKKHRLQTVFIRTVVVDHPKPHDNEIMVQVARPSWYPHDGLETPLGTFVYTFKDTSGNAVAMMVPATRGGGGGGRQEAAWALVYIGCRMSVDGLAFFSPTSRV
jgi:hypothetical protein